MTTSKLKKTQLPFPDTINRMGTGEAGETETEYTTSITTLNSGVNGDQAEINYETSPDIFALTPTARRRAVLGSASLQAFVQALWPLGLKGIPSEETLQEEYDRVLAASTTRTATSGERRTRTRRPFLYGSTTNS